MKVDINKINEVSKKDYKYWREARKRKDERNGIKEITRPIRNNYGNDELGTEYVKDLDNYIDHLLGIRKIENKETVHFELFKYFDQEYGLILLNQEISELLFLIQQLSFKIEKVSVDGV